MNKMNEENIHNFFCQIIFIIILQLKKSEKCHHCKRIVFIYARLVIVWKLLTEMRRYKLQERFSWQSNISKKIIKNFIMKREIRKLVIKTNHQILILTYTYGRILNLLLIMFILDVLSFVSGKRNYRNKDNVTSI